MVDFNPVFQATSPRGELAHDFQVVNRALRVLSACTQAVIRATDEPSLLQTLCHLITEEAAYRMAWVGYVCHDDYKTVQPVAWAGHEADYLKTARVSWGDSERGQGPVGRAIRSRQSIACQHMLVDPSYAPWREAAQQRGYQSSLVLLLQDETEVLGTLNIYSAEAAAFTPKELDLLTELADSLSFGILALRAKQRQQQAERELLLSKDKFSKAFYNSPIAKSIMTLDRGVYLEVNYAFTDLFGYMIDQVFGHTILDLELWVQPEDRDQMVQQLRSRGFLRDYEAQLQNLARERIDCRISAELINIGDTLCALSEIENITERKKNEKFILELNQILETRVQQRTAELTQATTQLQQLNQELSRSNQELEQFAYVASHDLQEPLRAITGYTQLLVSEYGDRLDDTAQSYAEVIIEGASRMRTLIQDLLAYSRVGTRGKNFALTDCNKVLQAVCSNLEVAITESRAEIQSDPLPTLKADPQQLVQLLQNLISNAIKFCQADHPCIQIRVIPREDDFVFELSDNGIGIKAQYLERIFEVFKRLHTRREYPGTGIGLAICKKIVLRHRGQIWVTSTPDVGTTFFFTIPRELYDSPELSAD